MNISSAEVFLRRLWSTHLVYRLPSFGYGKEALRARYKLYLADAAIAPAILMKGKTVLENPDALGACVETAVVSHLSSHSSAGQARFSYWRSAKEKEVGLIIEMGDRIVPFEVKYKSHRIQQSDIRGLIDFYDEKPAIEVGYILTKSPQDIGPLELKGKSSARLMRIPTAIFCYWLGESEISQRCVLE